MVTHVNTNNIDVFQNVRNAARVAGCCTLSTWLSRIDCFRYICYVMTCFTTEEAAIYRRKDSFTREDKTSVTWTTNLKK